MDVDLGLAALVDAVLNLLEHADVLGIGKRPIDRLVEFDLLLLRVELRPKLLKHLLGDDDERIGLLRFRLRLVGTGFGRALLVVGLGGGLGGGLGFPLGGGRAGVF